MVTINAIKSRAATTEVRWGDVKLEIMLEFGSSLSLVQQKVFHKAQGNSLNTPSQQVQLVTASGNELPILATFPPQNALVSSK